MERGRLAWPEAEGGKALLSREQFALLIGGFDLRQTRERKWYRKPMSAEPEEARKSA